jgi:hypothetical protein
MIYIAYACQTQAIYNIGNHTGAKYYFGKAFEIDPNNELAKKILTFD